MSLADELPPAIRKDGSRPSGVALLLDRVRDEHPDDYPTLVRFVDGEMGHTCQIAAEFVTDRYGVKVSHQQVERWRARNVNRHGH